MSIEYLFTKENLDICFRALAKEYRRLVRKDFPAELILIGGASVLANYGFRDVTYDIDAIIHGASAMNDAILKVSEDLGLPVGWLNSDFKYTSSYTPRLIQYSTYYKTFSNILTVRTISNEYLIAMKLMSARKYKNDISDIVGILAEQKKIGNPLTFEKIEKAVFDLYDSWDILPSESKQLILNILKENNAESLYEIYRDEEIATKTALLSFDEDYPNVLNVDNVNDIIAELKKKRK